MLMRLHKREEVSNAMQLHVRDMLSRTMPEQTARARHAEQAQKRCRGRLWRPYPMQVQKAEVSCKDETC